MENKVWKTFGIFETFEEADLIRKNISDINQLTKVKRCGPDGGNYKVIFWNEPPIKETKKKKSKKYKKGNKN